MLVEAEKEVKPVENVEPERVRNRGYGMDAYLREVESALGKKRIEALNSTLGQTDSARDTKINNLLLCELIESVKRLVLFAAMAVENTAKADSEAAGKKKP